MRIAQVVEACGGGVARHVIDLVDHLSAAGHEVTVFYSPLRAESDFIAGIGACGDVELVPIPMRRSVGLHDIAALWRLWREIGHRRPFDVIHGHSSKAGALVRLLPSAVKGRRLYTPHAFRSLDPALGRLPRTGYRVVERLLATRGGPVMLGSRQEREEARAIGIREADLVDLAFGVDCSAALPRNAARAQLGLRTHERVVGFVGRLEPQKRPDRVISAFAALEGPAHRLVMVGAGDREAALREQARTLGCDTRVIWLGRRHALDVMCAFDVLMVPSDYESLGYVLLEAASLGIPVATTNVGVATDLQRGGAPFALVDRVDDPETWSVALRHLLRHHTPSDPRQSFSPERMAEEVLSQYRGTVAASMEAA